MSTRVWLFGRPKAFLIAISMILICITLVAYALLSKGRHRSEGISLLKETYKSHRSIQSRIAEFDYAPVISTRGGGESIPDKFLVDRAERVLLDATYYKPDAQSHHALGVFHLLNKRFKEAIKEFEQALSFEPSSARLHSDLGAALLEWGKTELEKDRLQSQSTGSPIEELSRSLEHIQKALDVDASLKEAIFNLALVQEQLGLRFAARTTLTRYLELDADSGWAYEAREEMSALSQKEKASSLSKESLVAEFRTAFEEKNAERAWELISMNRSSLNGKYIAELLIDLYINQSLDLQKEAAAGTLSALSFLAELEVRKAGERYTEKLVEFYKTRQPADLGRLKKARDLIERAHNLYLVDRINEALSAYIEAKALFDALQDRCESLSAEYRIAYCRSENHNLDRSLPMFERLAALCEKENFKLLLVRNLLGAASDESSRRKYSRAISHALHSLQIARQVGDDLGAFSSLESLTMFYRAVGNIARVLACIQSNLEYSNCPSINQLQNFVHYSLVASALSSIGFVGSSLEYRKEASRFLMQDVPKDAALYFADLGATYTELGKYDEALANLTRSYEEAQAISAEPAKIKNLILTYVMLHKGSFHKNRHEFHEAFSNYDEALNLARAADYPAFEYQARKGRLLSYVALGEDPMAENEITETLKLLEQYRSEILEQENRNTFFDGEQDIYDLAIDYECSRRNNNRAFDYSEESRARSLLDLMKTETKEMSKAAPLHKKLLEVSRPIPLDVIRQRLPEHLKILQYSVLANKIVVWVVSSDQSTATVVDISQDDLSKKVRAYMESISHYSKDEAANIQAQSEELFDILIRPVSRLLSFDDSVCIVPDKVLNILPFESLISTETKKYLLEDYAVIYSPSASVLLACNEEAKGKESANSERLLAIGNPSFDFSLFKDLPDLPSAETEVEKIADSYRHQVTLTGAGAREETVKSEMQKADVIHFAAHSILDEDSYLRSKILLARETGLIHQGNDGILESHEIYNAKLPNTRLVVLSSCQSGIDHYYKGEGMMSLARSFIAARVPTVVATLWKVDSNAAAELMIEFHRFKQQEHLPVTESLRRAKLTMLSKEDGRFRHPYFWSAFIAIGGQASFDKVAEE